MLDQNSASPSPMILISIHTHNFHLQNTTRQPPISHVHNQTSVHLSIHVDTQIPTQPPDQPNIETTNMLVLSPGSCLDHPPTAPTSIVSNTLPPQDQLPTTHTHRATSSLMDPPPTDSASEQQDKTTGSIHPMVTRSCDGTRKPKTFSATCHPLPAALTTSTSPVAPTCSPKTAKISEWHAATAVEFEALQQNRTWSLVPPCPRTNIVCCKWVYRLKYNVDGSIERHKVRLVAKGFYQQPGIDFFETFSLMDKHTTIRIVLLLAVQFNWPIHQLDINNAFLNGDLKEEVYMQQPQGFVDTEH